MVDMLVVVLFCFGFRWVSVGVKICDFFLSWGRKLVVGKLLDRFCTVVLLSGKVYGFG